MTEEIIQVKISDHYYKKDDIDTQMSNKVDKDGNKVLSDNNYTNAEKTKLSNIIPADYVTNQSLSSILSSYVVTSTLNNYYTQDEINNIIPTKTSDLTNDGANGNNKYTTITNITPTAETDIDTYKTVGLYTFFNNDDVASMTPANKAKLPNGLGNNSFYLVVENKNNYAKQTLTRYNTGTTWIRIYNDNTVAKSWTSWVELSIEGHTHDDRYYTETEIDTALSSKSDSTHTHTKTDITDFPSIPSKISDLQNDSDFIETSQTIGLIKNDGTIDTTTYLTTHQDISGKENLSNKVASWSETTNNTRYPSEKLVHDSLSEKVDYSYVSDNYSPVSHSHYDTDIELDGNYHSSSFISDNGLTSQFIFNEFVATYLENLESQKITLTATLENGTTKSFTIYGNENTGD